MARSGGVLQTHSQLTNGELRSRESQLPRKHASHLVWLPSLEIQTLRRVCLLHLQPSTIRNKEADRTLWLQDSPWGNDLNVRLPMTFPSGYSLSPSYRSAVWAWVYMCLCMYGVCVCTSAYTPQAAVQERAFEPASAPHVYVSLCIFTCISASADGDKSYNVTRPRGAKLLQVHW